MYSRVPFKFMGFYDDYRQLALAIPRVHIHKQDSCRISRSRFKLAEDLLFIPCGSHLLPHGKITRIDESFHILICLRSKNLSLTPWPFFMAMVMNFCRIFKAFPKHQEGFICSNIELRCFGLWFVCRKKLQNNRLPNPWCKTGVYGTYSGLMAVKKHIYTNQKYNLPQNTTWTWVYLSVSH